MKIKMFGGDGPRMDSDIIRLNHIISDLLRHGVTTDTILSNRSDVSSLSSVEARLM